VPSGSAAIGIAIHSSCSAPKDDRPRSTAQWHAVQRARPGSRARRPGLQQHASPGILAASAPTRDREIDYGFG
jgi:hypothetical protein